MNQKINEFHLSGSVAPNSRSITTLQGLTVMQQ